MGEDTWLAWVRNESLWDEAEDIPPASGKEDTVMSKKHYWMVVMFLAEMLTKINHRDVIVTNPYPDMEDDTEFQFATNALDSNRRTNLNLNALQRLDDTICDEYQNWVDEAPLFYLEDDFLTSRVPVAITSRFGQNQQLAESRADRDQEVLNWAQDRDYKRIHYLTIALASHLRVHTVHSWRERLIADIRENFSAGIYNSRNDDTREIITWDELAEMPLVDDEGREIPIYCGMGFNIPRRIPRFSKHSLPHGVLVDLRKVKDLFQHELDEEDFYMDEDTAPVDVYTYPQAGTKIAGHFQANGLMLNVSVFVKLVNESLTYVPDAMDEDEEDALPRRPKNIVNGIACQGYNAVMHSTRGDSAQHHDAQLGMITGALSGCWATNPAGTRTARYLREKCARLLPHEAFATKIKNERILRDLRLENVFWIDIKAMDKDDQDGTRILTKIIRPLTYSWNHPVLMDELKPRVILFKAEATKIWKQGYDAWMQHCHPDTLQVELCSALERALNFMHTGNVAIIATSAMNPLWIGLSIIHDGLPCLNEAILPTVANKILIDKAQWPLNSRNMPVSASRCAQIRTYGLGHYNIFYAHLAMSTLSSRHLPVTFQEQNPNFNTANAFAYHCLCLFVQDCKDLVAATVKASIHNQVKLSLPIIAAHGEDRKKALSAWLKSDAPLAWSEEESVHSGAYCQLLMILKEDPDNQEFELKRSRASLTYMDIAKKIHLMVKKKKIGAPISSSGAFYHALPLAFARMKALLSSKTDKNEDYLIAIIARMMKKMNIHFIPWHKSDKSDTQARVVKGDWCSYRQSHRRSMQPWLHKSSIMSQMRHGA
ncbi:hypothetical protein M378DRAFT_182284 [Amanita muscaria Koide BX008]|uniref:DUF8190 domain-containing protein n=1 Tax=Amanita muscaria (strain Koide BX008) TaxID=946122 RepID=A0A0C2WF37_AMAMK|nr:hypothetical protein M378DRAFT_182284 [Amanita muscaria Koide BX008]